MPATQQQLTLLSQGEQGTICVGLMFRLGHTRADPVWSNPTTHTKWLCSCSFLLPFVRLCDLCTARSICHFKMNNVLSPGGFYFWLCSVLSLDLNATCAIGIWSICIALDYHIAFTLRSGGYFGFYYNSTIQLTCHIRQRKNNTYCIAVVLRWMA